MVLSWLLAELKRRKVPRTAMVYAGGGWMLLEVADVVFPRLGLPDWTVNLVLAAVLIGFPVAVVVAWIFDFDPQGIVRTHSASKEMPRPLSVANIAELILIGLLVTTVGYLYVSRLSLQQKLEQPQPTSSWNIDSGKGLTLKPERYRSIAVLPFTDMSQAGDQLWLTEGMAEELLNALAQVKDLNVMARTSSFAFRNTDKTIAEIATILGVQAVLEGSVRRSGERVRISAQLVDASSGFQIWSGAYERKLTDIFQLQDQIARAIVQALQVELGVAQADRLVVKQTTSLEAYNWFVRGRAIWNWDNRDNTEQSIRYFEKAVAADPDYALAWGYLAFSRMASMLWLSFDDVGPATIEAYDRALAIDPGQSEALATKALMTQLLDKDWKGAGKLYRQAMAATDNTNAIMLYASLYLMHIDKIPEAIRLIKDAEKRDPLHPGYKSNLAHLFLLSGDIESAIRKAQEALELNPGHVLTILYLIQIYAETGNFANLESLIGSIPRNLTKQPEIEASIGLYDVARGGEEKARDIYAGLLKKADELTPIAILYTAVLASALGEIEESISLLERLAEDGSWVQFHIPMIFMDNTIILGNPRYQALLRRMKLDGGSVAELHKRPVSP